MTQDVCALVGAEVHGPLLTRSSATRMSAFQQSHSLLEDVLSKIASIEDGCKALDSRLQRLSLQSAGLPGSLSHSASQSQSKQEGCGSGEHFQFLSLPTEVQLQVVQHVTDASSLCNLAQVCLVPCASDMQMHCAAVASVRDAADESCTFRKL